MRIRYGLLFLLCFNLSFAQNHRTIAHHQHLWLVYNGIFRLNDKFNLLTEYQWRRVGYGATWQQSLPRIGIEFKTKAGINFAGGYALPTTYPYGEQPVVAVFNEHRAWEQVSMGHTNGKFKFNHRYRFEQRWLEVKTPDPAGNYVFLKYTYLNRIRYRVMITYSIRKYEGSGNELLFMISDEAFINFGKNVARNIFDQNRVYAGLGFAFSEKYTASLGYLNQFIIKPDAVRCENNHTLQVGITFNL
ncbi:MAG TPA: DUF2490 domain-containing protein [Flavobacteriales bacterium]|nr:DUF2490 domain-containing protein [Flavobacteriales bacterium]